MRRYLVLLLLLFTAHFITAQKKTNRVIVGTVMTKEGYPIIGASITALGTKLKTVVDIEGFYTLEVPPKIKELHFTYTLFTPITVELSDQDTINVVLEKHGMPEPLGGFEKMEDYIRKNLRYPKAAKRAKVQGKVVVEFTLSISARFGSSGCHLRDFNIIESLGYGCDEEAIRLLKEGPMWSIPNKEHNFATARYTIEFKLKK